MRRRWLKKKILILKEKEEEEEKEKTIFEFLNYFNFSCYLLFLIIFNLNYFERLSTQRTHSSIVSLPLSNTPFMEDMSARECVDVAR